MVQKEKYFVRRDEFSQYYISQHVLPLLQEYDPSQIRFSSVDGRETAVPSCLCLLLVSTHHFSSE